MAARFLYLLKTYLTIVGLFLGAKVGFMCYNAAAHPFSLGDMADVIGHGLSLDLSTALYFLSVPFLCMVSTIFIRPTKLLCRILLVYYAVVALAFALAFVADTSLYEFWQFKLDASCLQYLETPTEAMASVSAGYLMVRLLATLLLTALFFAAFCLFGLPAHRGSPMQTRHAASLRLVSKASIASIASIAIPTSRHRLLESLAALVAIPLMVIGIRGGLGESTTNIGQVYFSQQQFLNHSAVNPVFSFLASFEKTASNNVVYHFMEDEESQRIVASLYNTESKGCDTLLTTQTPNIVVILLESCGATFTELGGRADVTPNLNRLAREGIYFTNCYGNSWRTDRGTVCALSGYPSFPTMSVMKIPSKTRQLPNIARSLQRERGYTTHYLYGGDINYTNMRSYLIAGGFKSLTWMKDYSAEEQRTAKWGVRDDITFGTLYNLCTTLPQPFLIGYSTLSSHQPWDVPIKQFDDEVLNAFYYLDQCLGQFIERLRQTSLWQNTLVVLLPDHGILYKEHDETSPLKNHIPMIWVGGAVREPRRIEQVCNQTDLPATLLGRLGVGHDEFTFSRDVLSTTYMQPFAINTFDDGFSMYDSISFVNYDFISNRVVAERGNNTQQLISRAKAILQVASKDLDKR